MAYSRDLAVMDYHGLSWTIMDYRGLSLTVLDCPGLLWTVVAGATPLTTPPPMFRQITEFGYF